MKKHFSGKSIITKSASVLCVLSALYGMPNLNNQVVLPTTVINMSTAEAAVTSQQWEPSVKAGINDFLAAYAINLLIIRQAKAMLYLTLTIPPLLWMWKNSCNLAVGSSGLCHSAKSNGAGASNRHSY